MKKTFAFLALASSMALSAQTQMSGIDVSVSFGFTSNTPVQLSLADYRALVPQSAILQRDFTDFSAGYNYYDYQVNSSSFFNVLWGFKLKSSTNFEQRIRVGFTYNGSSSHSTSAYKSTTVPFDTLISQRTGEVYYLDSNYYQNVNAYNAQDAMMLDASYIIRSNATRRMSFYAGVGVMAGALVNSKINVNYNEGTNDYSDYYSYENYTQENEYYNLDPGFVGQLYMPVGFDFRLSAKNEFFKRMHVFIELRPGIQYLNLPEIGGSTQFNFGMALFGLRHEF